VERWAGTPGTVGTVAVVGLGKIGLPLAAQYAAAGWHVIGVDVLASVVDAVNSGRSHIDEEPGLGERISEANAKGLLEATSSHADAAARSDVVVMIVPLMLSPDRQPDYRAMDAATEAVGATLRPGTLVVYETTLPVGDTRTRFGAILERQSGLHVGDGNAGLYLAFSPERVYSGRVFRDLSTYPKLVGGVNEASTSRAAAFYESVLPAEVWRLGSSEAAEFAKLAETTYRDVNIALANEFARYAERVGVDILEVIRGSNSQPYSHIHQPGIGVGGHCIPVYPHFMLHGAPDLALVRTSREINDGQLDIAVEAVARQLGGLEKVPVLVLGLTYRANVHELAYSRGAALVEALRRSGAEVLAYDPLLDDVEVERIGARPYAWGTTSPVRAIVTQTADPAWSVLRYTDFPQLEVVYDGRNSLRDALPPPPVVYLGVGLGER
jgi:nucleotide sugar dehydrogenase